jgi:hypothetical protein
MSTVHLKGPFPLITSQPLPGGNVYAVSSEIDVSLIDFVILDLDYTSIAVDGALMMKWDFESQNGGPWRGASIKNLGAPTKTADGLVTTVDYDIRLFPAKSISTDFKLCTKGRNRLRFWFTDASVVAPGGLIATFSAWVGSQLT